MDHGPGPEPKKELQPFAFPFPGWVIFKMDIGATQELKCCWGIPGIRLEQLKNEIETIWELELGWGIPGIGMGLKQNMNQLKQLRNQLK